jgi:hypothetical protein
MKTLHTVVGLSLLFAIGSVSASEVTGTLSTGLGNSSVTGVVIAAPTASPTAGTYTSAQSVTLTSSGSLSVHYTVDGTTPTCTTGITYSGAISVGSSQTVQAVACYANSAVSQVMSQAYVINATVTTTTGGGGGGGGGGISYYVPATASTTTTTGGTTATTTTSSGTVGTGGAVGQVLGASTFNFLKDLTLTSKGTDVTELQKVLIKEGFLKLVTPTGKFGPMTKDALIKWQKKYKLPTTGFFGPMSRAFLNKQVVTKTN